MGGNTTTGLAFGSVPATSVLPTGLARTTLDTLGQWIVNDRLPPSEVMPTEPELAASLGVSRTTVRDAVKVLSGKGLVRTARRYGTRITPVSSWNLLDADVIAWHHPDHPRMRRIFAETTELRSIVEPAAAALAANRATSEQSDVILAAAQAMYPELDVQALFLADCRFHLTILEATQNQVMHQLQPIVLTMLRSSVVSAKMRRMRGWSGRCQAMTSASSRFQDDTGVMRVP